MTSSSLLNFRIISLKMAGEEETYEHSDFCNVPLFMCLNTPDGSVQMGGACDQTETDCIWRLRATDDAPLTKDNTILTIANGRLCANFNGKDYEFFLPLATKDAHECGENAIATISEGGKITVKIPLPDKVEYPIVYIAINEE